MTKKHSLLISIFAVAILLLFTTAAFADARWVRLPDSLAKRFAPGTIVIQTKKRALYLVMNQGYAIRYPVATPKKGRDWFGTANIIYMEQWPAWEPPPVVRADHPELPDVVPAGSPLNPLGAAAMRTDRYDGGQVAIHGTSDKIRHTIGTAASYGCIRMYNEDVLDLYNRVGVGTVIVKLK